MWYSRTVFTDMLIFRYEYHFIKIVSWYNLTPYFKYLAVEKCKHEHTFGSILEGIYCKAFSYRRLPKFGTEQQTSPSCFSVLVEILP